MNREHQISAVPGALPHDDDRPPIVTGDPAPPPGAAELPYQPLRPTVWLRPVIEPRLWRDAHAEIGFPGHHGYVRRFWTAVIGPGAVADLLRLAVAARRDRSLPRPIYLPVLIRENLARQDAGTVYVRPTVPPLAADQVRRLAPALRREHATYRLQSTAGADGV